MCPPPLWMIEESMRHFGEKGINAAKYPYLFMSILMKPTIVICDPQGAQDLFVTHNKFSDKASNLFKIIGERIVGNGTPIMSNGADWKNKRRA